MAIKTENMITWALLGFIAYELYQSNQPAPGLKSVSIETEAPPWVQQLSESESYDYALAMQSNPQLGDTIIDNILSIPQGPGGSFENNPPGTDYFFPHPGVFCR